MAPPVGRPGRSAFCLQIYLILRAQQVNPGSPAERAGLVPGDAVIKINNVDVYNLKHKDAQDVVVRAGPAFEMTVQRGGLTWRPSVTPTGHVPAPSPVISNNISPVTRTSLAAPKGDNFGAVGTGHNLSAKPFAPQVNGSLNGGPRLVNKQYNTPVKLYSEDTIAETLAAQSEVLAPGVVGVNFKKNEKNYDASNSAVLRMLKETENEPRTPTEEPDSGIITTPNSGIAGLRHVQAPATKPAPSSPQLPPGQNICDDCERLIVGVFVRIKDKNLHVECFKCSTCGTSLKNVGYYNINNKLYCDIHAKSAAQRTLSTHSLPTPSPLSPKLNNSFASPYQTSNLSGPRPFSSVSGPLSPHNTLPRSTGPISPVSQVPPPSYNTPIHNTPSYSPVSSTDRQKNHRSTKLCHATQETENLVELDEVDVPLPSHPPPPPPVPVYSQINITIPYQNTTLPFQSTSPQLDSIGSSPRSDYSSYSSSSSKNHHSEGYPASKEAAREKIMSEIKNLTPKLKNVNVSEKQSPKMNSIETTTTTKKVTSELFVPINNYQQKFETKRSSLYLPDNVTYSNTMDSTATSKKITNGDDEKTFKGGDGLPSLPICCKCNAEIARGPFITALGKIWCPNHFICATPSCRRPLQDLGFVEEKGQLYCEYCFEKYLAPTCAKCSTKIKTDCLKAIGKNFHPECFNCVYCGKLFGNSSFFIEDGSPYCEADWNELFTTKCFACGFPVEAGDRWVEALNNNYHSQCFNCTMCKKNLEGQSFFAKGGRPFCKNHAR
nr:unnamed protein product [Callosobruchus analis]